MIKFIRSLTLIAAIFLVAFLIFRVDAENELQNAYTAYNHYDFDNAMRHARRAYVFSFDNKTIKKDSLWIQLRIALKTRRYKKAHEYLNNLIKINPRCYMCYVLRGEIEYRHGQFKKAFNDFKVGIKEASNISNSYLSYYYARWGLASLHINRYKFAKMCSDKALYLNSKSIMAHLLKSKLLFKSGKLKKAFDESETAYKLAKNNPNFFSTKEGRMWLKYIAYLRVKVRDLDK
jgi:Tfp pilus assembly protein PilF